MTLCLTYVSIFAGIIAILGIVILAYTALTTDENRASKTKTKQLKKESKKQELKGKFYVKYGSDLGSASSGYTPDPNYPSLAPDIINKFLAEHPAFPLPFFWKNRNLVIIGTIISIIGVVLGIISQIFC
ncbi:MAG TPA: hypothetical protein VGR54_05560 [Nitrosopumilaceae archaeon]|nr:hypothetical protein [Nitrosopumilaceae archaeon]